MELVEAVSELLALQVDRPPEGREVVAALTPRAVLVETGDRNLYIPAWGRSTHGSSDVFLSFEGGVAGIAIWDDARGWGAYAELAVTSGSLQDLISVVGEMQPVARNPDDFHSGPRCFTAVERAGKRIRVFAEVDRQDNERLTWVTIHFQT